jgi:hypothetical protein
VPTVRFEILYVFLVLAHDRRRILHFGVTAHPTAEWTAQQLREAFPWDSAPRYLLRDRDQIFGKNFVDQVKELGIKQVLPAPRSPWQRAYVERPIGSIRRECLDHIIVLGERSLHRALASYTSYHHNWRTHLSLGKDAPRPRRYSLLQTVRWSKFAKSVVYTIITNPGLTPSVARLHWIECPRLPAGDGSACRRYDAGRFRLRAPRDGTD